MTGMRSGLLLTFGVLLPAIALGVELFTGMNAEIFFDPIPTPWHCLLVAFVALANAYGWLVLRDQKLMQARRALLANGFAIGVALFYSVLFLPLLPLGAVGIVFFGLGILVWAPVASLIVAIRLRVHLARFYEVNAWRRVWIGIGIAFIGLFAIDLPITLTRVGAYLAVDDAVATRARGLRLLRSLGSEEELLRMCYVRRGRATDMVSFLLDMDRHVSTQDARQLYYRTTGRTFNSVPAPEHLLFDAQQGTETVGGRLEGLRLASSRLDGSASADAALGYLEWTLVFKNDSSVQREARSQIALPPGAVVSRVTLWINGEEREAAFAGRSEVRRAYEAVVNQRRDPVLVTRAGPDRIAMQLFPVPPTGEMKVRIGMTMPLQLTTSREGEMRLPFFHERNFEIREDLRHSVWIESKSKMRGNFRADLEDSSLAEADSAITVMRDDRDAAWSSDTRSPGYIVRQTIAEDVTGARPRRLVVVMDGSASMKRMAPDIAQHLRGIPSDVEVRLLFAHDDADRSNENRVLTGAGAGNEVETFDYRGGHDNTTALVRALDLAFADPATVLLWIHGPQPVLLDTEEALLQRLARGPQLAHWYEMQVAPGPNLLDEKLDASVKIETLRGNDLSRMVAKWRTGERPLIVRRERVVAEAKDMVATDSTSDHLVRLWANDEIARLIYTQPQRRADAIALAQQYQLVTPVSGAVVLETQQQYDAAGLRPVPEGTVPTIPEPEEWALILVALMVLAYVYRNRRALLTPRAV